MKPSHSDGAMVLEKPLMYTPQAVQRRQPGLGGLRQFAVQIVFNHPESVSFGGLQYAYRASRRVGGAGRILQDRIGKKDFRPMDLRQFFKPLQINAADDARHADDLDITQAQHGNQVAITGFFDEHGVVGLDQRAHDQVQRLRHAVGGDNLVRCDIEQPGGERFGDGLAQRRVAVGMTITDLLRGGRADDAPLGGMDYAPSFQMGIRWRLRRRKKSLG